FFHRHVGGSSGDGRAERPRTVFFIGEPDTPVRPHAVVSGEWLASQRWPEGVNHTRLVLGGPAVAPARVTTGVMTGQWCPPPPATGQFLDQSRDDAQSALFQSEPLAEPLELFGSRSCGFGCAIRARARSYRSSSRTSPPTARRS